MPTTKQLAALKDLQRSIGLTDDQWTAKFGDLSDQQLSTMADGVLATPVFHRKMNEFDAQLKAKDAEVQARKTELETQYTQEINRLGQLATTVQQTAGQDGHAVRAYQAKLNEIKARYALDDAEVAVDVQTAQFNQQFQQPQNPYQQQQFLQQPNQGTAANPGYITQADLQKAIAEAQANANSTLAINLKRNNDFIKEFGEPLDIDKILAYANTHSVDVDTAIQDVYDVPAKREAKAKAQRQTEIDAAVAEARKSWEQSRATDGLFDANSVAPSIAAQKSIWNIKSPENVPPPTGQINVSDPARLADQARRGAEALARLNS